MAATDFRVALSQRPFVKLSGGGNDFVLFDHRKAWLDDPRRVVPALCRRGVGVGADAVLLLENDEQADVRMVYYNADGSRAPMCGNGAMCMARYVVSDGIVPGPRLTIRTDAGLVCAIVPDPAGPEVSLILTPPRDLDLSIDEPPYQRIGFLDTTTPHLVALVSDIDRVDVATEGCRLRFDDRWAPRGTNVNFITIIDRSTIAMRTYERGVEAETLSCGTGATAAAILAWLWDAVEPPVVVRTKGGFPIRIDFDAPGGRGIPAEPRIAGHARIVYRGHLDEIGPVDREISAQ